MKNSLRWLKLTTAQARERRKYWNCCEINIQLTLFTSQVICFYEQRQIVCCSPESSRSLVQLADYIDILTKSKLVINNSKDLFNTNYGWPICRNKHLMVNILYMAILKKCIYADEEKKIKHQCKLKILPVLKKNWQCILL